MANIGLVLLGGGCKTAREVGMPTCLWTRSLKPIKIQGVSAGALNAAKLAESGPEELHKVWLKIEEKGPAYIFQRQLVTAFVHKEEFIYSRKGLENLIDENIDARKVLASDIEIEVVTQNLTKKRTEIFSNKPFPGFDSDGSGKKNIIRHVVTDPEIMKRAITASACLPGLFPSKDIFGNGQSYCDGFWMELETFTDCCDTIFLIDNDTAATGLDLDEGRFERIIRQTFSSFSYTLDALIEEKIGRFQDRHPDFNTKIDSPMDFLKKFWREVTGSAKRLIVLSPSEPIPSLRLHRFNKDAKDISRAITQSIIQAQKCLDDLKL